MEYKLIEVRKYFTVVFFIFLAGCGYIENDGVLSSKVVVGNFQVVRLENSDEANLMLVKSSSSRSGIIDYNCKRVFYDSIGKMIYVEAILNKYNNIYYVVKVLNSDSVDPTKAYEVNEISGARFDSLSSLSILIDEKRVK